MVKIFTLQRRLCNRKVEVINVSWVVTMKISRLYYIKDVNVLTEKSTSVQNVPVSNTKIYQWRVAITSLYKQLNRTCF